MEAWHFITEDRRNPRTLLPVKIGMTERVKGAIIPERWGLHASAEAADAVFWARGLCVCRVRLGGEIVGGRQKIAASERTVLWMADARAAVWEWLCLCAEAALARTRIFDESPKEAIAARRLWIGCAAQGEAAMNDLRATLRRCLHRACGQNADGKRCAERERQPLEARTAIRMCAALVEAGGRQSPWRDAAARPPDYAAASRAWEVERLEAKLMRLKPGA